MSNTEFITALIAKRDAIAARHDALLAAREYLAAADLLPDLRFAGREAHEALMTR